MKIVAHVQSCFVEKFGTPRQSGLVEQAQGTIVMAPEFASEDWLRGIDQFDYLWLIFLFHHNETEVAENPLARPPRGKGEVKYGRFATRSPYRPNPIGLSLVKLLSVDFDKAEIQISGLDLIDGTPLIDIKPYLPDYDYRKDARFVSDDLFEAPGKLPVVFSSEIALDAGDRDLITAILAEDPRPYYHWKPQFDGRRYKSLLKQMEVTWYIDQQTVVVESVQNLK